MGRKPAYLLLVGDCELGQEEQPWCVPSRTCKLYRWRIVQREDFASDTLWGDFDNDLVPDIPVGRLPVRNKEQLDVLVNKILAFENRPSTLEDLRVPIYAGSSGYNPILDSMATHLLVNTVNKNLAVWLRPWIISADQMHSLCGWPQEQGQTFTRQLKAGGLMAVLMGHGSTKHFFAMKFRGKHITYGAKEAAKLMSVGKVAAPTVIFTCYSGNFTAEKNCLTESLLLMPAGPVATIGATTESHPLTNYFSAVCLMRQMRQKNKRLGSLWLNAQKQAIKTHDIFMEKMLCNVEGKLEEKINTDKLRRDQILMYALLGDPATRLHVPDTLACTIELKRNNCHWHVEKPQAALKLYVDFRPDGQSFPQVQLPLHKTSARQNLHLANDVFNFKSITELSADQSWEGTINTPGVLRLVAVAPDRFYVTAQEIKFDVSE